MPSERVSYRTCPLCEATCGLEITTSNGDVTAIRGDADDVFSHGFLCPKGFALKALHEDPDCLRTPMRRTASGDFEPVGWDEAFAEIDERLTPILRDGGRNAVGVYIGNPAAHHLAPVLYGRVFLKALGSRNIYSASTVDQYPKQFASGLMFGTGFSVPVPDVDRTDHLMILGANPLASNGSLLTAPDMRGRLRAIRARGGKVVVIDPRRSRTAEEADEHHFIRPGTDAHLLMAIAHVLVDEGLADPGPLADHCAGLDEVLALTEPFAPNVVAPVCGIEADEIRRMARELAAAPSAAVYGRIGTCTQEYGSLASWLVDVVNVLTGNLDRPGGAMFARAPAGSSNTTGEPGRGRGIRFGRWQSRVRGMNEVFGELPVACLAEEIETPGEGQIRAMVTIAGNPTVSTPNAGRLARAFASLEFMVSLDIYVNETTRHANLILPAPSPLQRSHFDLALYNFSAHNVANYSPPVFPLEDGTPDEWETLLRLTGIVAGQGAAADVDALDQMVAKGLIDRELSTPGSRLEGRDADELLAELSARRGPDRLLDLLLRAGPYELTLDDLEAAPHGIDLGALEPRIPAVLRTPSGKIELAPEPLVADVSRLRESLSQRANGEVVLIGRRQLRSNNSWMHNLPKLVSGPERCTLHVHPDTAAAHGLVDGATASVRSRAGEVEVLVEATDAIMPGVVSIPHGWGHDTDGAELSVAREHAGVNSNILADEELVEPLTGNAVLNGIPVELAPVRDAAVAPG
jgi:anaerobic selenocysteine-containing dehydrogenase